MMKLFNAARYELWLMAVLLALANLAHAAAPSRPFKASLDLTHAVGRLEKCPGPTPGVFGAGGILFGSGHATHLGAVQVSGNHCINLRQDNSLYVFNGAMIFTAPNGDTVTADYTGFLEPTSANTYSFEGNYFITGGTGRFQDASGTGALFGTFQGDFQSQSVSLTADGRIKY